MKNTYKPALYTALIAGIISGGVLIVSLTASAQSASRYFGLAMALAIICLLVSFFFTSQFYLKARRQGNQRNLAKSVIPISVLVLTVPLLLVSYFTTQFAQASHTVTFVNHSDKVIKKIFLSNGDEKYFLKPVDPGESVTTALIFKEKSKVEYTFNLEHEVFHGVLLQEGAQDTGGQVMLTVGRTERVSVKEIP
ncbi:MAG: hypothetical protein R3240_10285 [Gammaproteobacteria bacterium]|nr:hypothetical protein [Gammaproteobacteria bacterium]